MVQEEEFERLTRAREPESLVEFFARSPWAEVDLRFDQRSDYGREIEMRADFSSTPTVISELVCKKPEPKVVQWIQDTNEEL